MRSFIVVSLLRLLITGTAEIYLPPQEEGKKVIIEILDSNIRIIIPLLICYKHSCLAKLFLAMHFHGLFSHITI